MITKPGRLMTGNTLHGQVSRRPRCSQYQAGFMFGERPRKPKILNCLVPTTKHGGRSVIIWAASSWYSTGHTINLNGPITASDYVDILGNHPMVHMLVPNYDAIFQYDNSPIHTARSVRPCFQEHEDALQPPPWPEQSPALNITEPLQSVLESRVKSRFPPPSSLKQLEDILVYNSN